jgi:hypothetical protein
VVARLARLLERSQETKRGHQEAHDELCREVARLQREGLSARALAEPLGVPQRTVQHWIEYGETLLG